MCVVAIFFYLLLSWWYYSTGFSLQTIVAFSVNVHIIRNPLITGVIRDVMFTFAAYLVSITTIVSNLHIINHRFTTAAAAVAACVARSFSDGGIFQTETSIFTTLT